MGTTHHRDTEGNRRLERVARGLANRGHDVTVFCAAWWGGYDDQRTIDDVTFRGVTVSPAATSFSVRLPALLARYRPDVIHVRPEPIASVFAASTGGTLAQAPLIMDWYGDVDFEESITVRQALREAGAVVTPSEMVRTNVRELGAFDERTHVIPESIDYSAIREVEPAEEVSVAFGHRLDSSANLDSLLLALGELRDRDWTAIIVGDGPQRRDCEEYAEDLRIDDRVTFAGECTREERIAIYRGAHTFVQTAYRESFAREFLWGLASGCVGIVEYQAKSAAHELVEKHERSFRVTDPEELAESIVSAGKFDRENSDERFRSYDTQTILSSYIDLYKDVQEAHWLF